MDVLTFNIDTNIGRTEEGYARDSFPEWRVNNRIPLILKWLEKIIKERRPDVIHLQEGRNFITKFGDVVDSVWPIFDFLRENKYEVTTKSYNPSDKSFVYITAVSSDNYQIVDKKAVYLTKTPEISTNRSLTLEEIKDNNFGKKTILGPSTGKGLPPSWRRMGAFSSHY